MKEKLKKVVEMKRKVKMSVQLETKLPTDQRTILEVGSMG